MPQSSLDAAEDARLAALRGLEMLDTPADPTLDRITALAAELFDAPLAAITLVGAERTWIKSRWGETPDELPREETFCHHTIRAPAGSTFLVEDARSHPQFCDLPMVRAPDGLRFYLGAPLVDGSGHALGALCVADSRPRGAGERERRRLQVLAELVMDELELRRTARQVLEAQRLLSLAESVAGVGHWRIRRSDGYMTWSDEVYRIHGLEKAGFDPNLEAGIGFYHPDDQAKVAELVEEAFRTRQGFTFTLRLRRADGALRRVSSRAMCELDGHGEVAALFGVFQDITEQLELVEAAEAAARAKSDFLANMSHELRTPLNSIIGFTHVLVRDGQLAPAHRIQLKRIEEAGRGLLTVVNDVLDFSRMEEEGVKLSPQVFSPVRLLENLVALLHSQATDKGLALVVDYPSDRQLSVRGDVDRLRQVLANLLSNAIKFTAHGQVRLALQTRRRGAEVQLDFQVADTGIGIAADQIEGLFRRFAQADASISRRFGGTGLGLAISKRLVEAMDGSIEVWSELGHGATFVVRLQLPLAAGEADAEPAAEVLPPEGAAAALKVLVAEDVPVNQELVRLMLDPLGCEVTVVADGEAAVDAAEAGAFDLILMDMQMPVLDGLEATRTIRRLGGRAARTPIVALTANVLPEQIERCRRAGMDDHVAKPFVTEDLQAVVHKWAARRRAPEPLGDTVLDDLAAQIGPAAVQRLLAGLDEQMDKIMQAAPEGVDGAVLSRLAHSLRGAAGALGYGETARACQAVETAHREGEATAPLFTALQAACASARRGLSERLAA